MSANLTILIASNRLISGWFDEYHAGTLSIAEIKALIPQYAKRQKLRLHSRGLADLESRVLRELHDHSSYRARKEQAA